MRISRRGSSHDEGLKSRDATAKSVTWVSEGKCLRICSARVPDFSGRGHHDYEIEISLEEFRRMLDALGTVAGPDIGELGNGLASSLRALVRLTVATVWPEGSPAPRP